MVAVAGLGALGGAAAGSAGASGGFGSLLTGGLLGGGLSSLFGGGGEGREAAQLQAAAFQNAINELRRQFEVTQENVSPFLQAGQGAVPQVVQGTTAGGLDERLAGIFDSNIFGSLVDERTRAVQNQLAASGQSRSGLGLLEAARVPTQLGLELENQLFGRSANLAGSGQNAAIGLGALGQQNAQSIAGLQGDIGGALSSGILTDAQADAATKQGVLNAAAIGAGLVFSDPVLKKNVSPVCKLGDLVIYTWDWIEGAKGTLIENCSKVGFMADQVRELYPQYVSTVCGFDMIDYPPLLNKLEAEHG